MLLIPFAWKLLMYATIEETSSSLEIEIEILLVFANNFAEISQLTMVMPVALFFLYVHFDKILVQMIQMT